MSAAMPRVYNSGSPSRTSARGRPDHQDDLLCCAARSGKQLEQARIAGRLAPVRRQRHGCRSLAILLLLVSPLAQVDGGPPSTAVVSRLEREGADLAVGRVQRPHAGRRRAPRLRAAGAIAIRVGGLQSSIATRRSSPPMLVSCATSHTTTNRSRSAPGAEQRDQASAGRAAMSALPESYCADRWRSLIRKARRCAAGRVRRLLAILLRRIGDRASASPGSVPDPPPIPAS